MFTIEPLAREFSEQIQAKIDQKTKPLGALGALESTALQLANIESEIAGQWQSISVNAPQMLVFAGDHGIAAKGVSIAPSEVTHQMVMNFLAGGAAINCFCRQFYIDMQVIDCGIKLPIPSDIARQHQNFIEQRLGTGTVDFSEQAAMSVEQVKKGIELGAKLAEKAAKSGKNLLMFGEMGIANTSSASALVCALLGLTAEQAVGLGTGITNEQLQLKVSLVKQAVSRKSIIENNLTSEIDILTLMAELAGFEIVQMTGAMLGGAQAKLPMLIDGFIVSVAALLATKIAPNSRDYMIFAHKSHEQAHQKILEGLEATPLLDLSLRLGEGTGAALAYPLLQATTAFYNDMASFESAGVTV